MKTLEKNGKFYSLDGGVVSEITPREYSNIQTAKDTGPIESALVGAGKVMSNIPGMSLVFGEMPEERGQYDALKQQHPYATTAGEIVPSVVGPVRAGLAGQAAYSALSGAGLSEDRLLGGVLGAGGAVGSDMAFRVVGKIKNALTSIGRSSGRVPTELTEAGYILTPAQKTGKQSAMKLERGLSKTPQGADIVGDMGALNEELLLTRMNEAVGLPANSGPLNRQARDIAADNIGDRMRGAVADSDMQISESLGKRISRIIKNDDMLELPEIPSGGYLSGDDYMRVRSGLTDAQRASQGPARNYIKKTISQIDDEFLNVAGPDQAQAYRVAREQYKNLIQMEKGSALTPDGLPNYKTMGNAFRGKTGYGKRGVQNALPETQALIRDIDNLSGKAVNPYIGDSGTAEGGLRSMLNPSNWAEGALAKQYYERGGSLGGLLAPSDPIFGNIGAAAGRGMAGLLSE